MFEEEAQRIRVAVIRAMEAQGENIDEYTDALTSFSDDNTYLTALPTWEDSSLICTTDESDRSKKVTDFSDDSVPAEDDAREEEVEFAYLQALFDDVRTQSAAAMLVMPTRWIDVDLIPDHQSADDWEMFVYEYLEEHTAQREQAKADVSTVASSVHSATCAVGVPRMLRQGDESFDSINSTEESLMKARIENETIDTLEENVICDTADGSNASGSAVEDKLLEPECSDIVVLTGKHSYYLYSSLYMTEAYAHWAFLANENDQVATFVECVREESRIYPRPIEALSFTNDPFAMTLDEVAKLWEMVRDSGAYPDLDTVTASNGDVYYFSTEYLTPAYAKSLAEWDSVERDMFL